jgi:hypothetical protein
MFFFQFPGYVRKIKNEVYKFVIQHSLNIVMYIKDWLNVKKNIKFDHV